MGQSTKSKTKRRNKAKRAAARLAAGVRKQPVEKNEDGTLKPYAPPPEAPT